MTTNAAIASQKYTHNPDVIEELRVRDGLPNVFEKLRNREPVNVVYLGGSITHADGWRPKTFAWLESQFPDVAFTHTDAAVPGTGADFAACRYVQDVHPHHPDLVFVEYRVNMGGGVEARAIEGIIRQLWGANRETDICLVYTLGRWMLEELENGGKQHFFGKVMEETANTYGIPSIDLAPEVLRQKKAGTLIFQTTKPVEDKLVFSKDGVHPGDAGHELYAQIVERSITTMMGQGTPGPHALPSPMQNQHLRDATLVPISAAKTSGDWQPVNKETDAIYRDDVFRTGKMLSDAIQCSEEGATLTINWTGTRLSFTHIPQGKGIVVLASTDGSVPAPIESDQTGKRFFAKFASLPELPQGEHTTTLTISTLPDNTTFYAGQLLLLRDPAPSMKSRTLYDFEGDQVTEDALAEHVRCEWVTERGVTSGTKALQVVYPGTPLYKKVAFEPKVAWDVSDVGHCFIALDITNLSDASAQLFMSVQDAKQSVTAHVNIGAQSSGTYYYDLAGPNQALNLGMTGWPGRGAQAVPFQYAWGERVLDLSSLKHIGLYMKGNLTDRTLVFDRIRIVPNSQGDAADLKNLVDEYGQYTGADWPNKVHSDEELKAQAKRESTGDVWEDRSKFGGWHVGPQLDATGFFRTAKIDGKWTLVDPEGYLFFATGIANCRLVNTPTVTGVDFANAASRQGPRVASELRHNLFSWLPEANDPLAAHYNYVSSVHTGPLKQGETFSFYTSNLQRKYGADYLNRWRDVTLDRMQSWGFTCFGNWTDARFYGNKRVAYFANASISGPHKRLSSGSDYWGGIHDPFDPEFAESARRAIAEVDAEVSGDPWCIGVFVDNELSWGNQWGDEKRYGLVINALARDVESCPAKAAFVNLLKARYDTIEDLNRAWGATLDSWGSLGAGFTHEGELAGERRTDFSTLSETLASEYFKVVNRELKRVMPNHLYFGSRFSDWGLTPEAVQGAAKHTDVISYNLYTEGLPGHFGDWLAEIDRPSMLGEFHFGATDRGMFHGGICTASSQQDRGVKYSAYMKSVIDNPYFVGAHWFQYIDSPTTGRAVDGENYNSGFVNGTDHPYAELVQAAREVNRDLYQLRFGDGKH